MKWNFSIYPKLVIAFLFVISPLYFIGLQIVDQGKASVAEELTSSLESRLRYYSNLLVTELERMIMLQREFISDKDLHKLGYSSSILSDFERSQSIRRIQDKLMLLENSSNYIESVKAHIPAINRLVASRKYELLPEEEFKAINSMFSSPEASTFQHWKGKLFLNLRYPETIQKGRSPAFLLSIELSLPELKKALAQFTDFRNSGSVLMDTWGGWHIGDDKHPSITNSLTAFISADPQLQMDGLQTVVLDGIEYLVEHRYSPAMQAIMLVYVDKEDAFGKLDAYQNRIVRLSVLSIIIILVFSYWIYRMIHQPLTRLVRSFRLVEKGKLQPIEKINRHDEFNYLYTQYNKMVEKLNVLIYQVYEQKLRAQSSELKQLQSQINPHFLYNTYFILYRLAMINDNESVGRFSSYLGEYFQYITHNHLDEVPIELEIKHTRTYTEIQNMRFSNRITIDFKELTPELRHITVPKVILQPVIENAYKHGLEDKLKDGMLRISFEDFREEQTLLIHVEDNGTEMTDRKLDVLRSLLVNGGDAAESAGLRNVHRRLQLLYGGQSGLRLNLSTLGGLKVGMVIRYGEARNNVPYSDC